MVASGIILGSWNGQFYNLIFLNHYLCLSTATVRVCAIAWHKVPTSEHDFFPSNEPRFGCLLLKVSQLRSNPKGKCLETRKMQKRQEKVVSHDRHTPSVTGYG